MTTDSKTSIHRGNGQNMLFVMLSQEVHNKMYTVLSLIDAQCASGKAWVRVYSFFKSGSNVVTHYIGFYTQCLEANRIRNVAPLKYAHVQCLQVN